MKMISQAECEEWLKANLGPTLTLKTMEEKYPNRQLTTSGTTTIDAGQTLALAGGSLSTGALVVNGTLAFNNGTLAITGGGLTIGAGGVLGSSLSLRIGAAFSVARVREIGYSFAGIDPSGLFF